MKKLISISIIVLVVLFSCKETTNKTKKDEPIKSIASDNSKNIQKTSQKEQTIEAFLKQLQTAVKNNDVVTIEKSLQFPFEFNWGGESSFYKNYKEIKEGSDKFLYILEAKNIEKEGDMFLITYQEPNDDDYFVTFIAVKDGNSFKLKSFMQPH